MALEWLSGYFLEDGWHVLLGEEASESPCPLPALEDPPPHLMLLNETQNFTKSPCTGRVPWATAQAGNLENSLKLRTGSRPPPLPQRAGGLSMGWGCH